MTLNDALIMSYVKRGIGYGYHILTHVNESRSGEWVEFSRAGLYKTLDKLEKSGYLEKTFEKDGARPQRKVYRITSAGEQALKEFLASGFDFDYQAKNDFDAYLVTAVAASPEPGVLSDCVRKRIESATAQIQRLRNEWPEDTSSYPFIVYALYKRRMQSLEMEIEWLQWFENTLRGVTGDVLNTVWSDIRTAD